MFDECFVLIPCHTLEDFPRQLDDDHARGLLGGWTAAWHPQLLAGSKKLPQWARADTVPAKLADCLLLVPDASAKRTPSSLAGEAEKAEKCRLIRGNSRGEFLEQIAAALACDLTAAECPSADRTLVPEDFYALGYTWLQVQLMTRRLRYTSNLDEIYFTTRATAAAQAFVEGRGDDAATALHDAFDCLAEERDHYFSSDPHLVDLTLLAPTTLGKSLEKTLDRAASAGELPINFLIDPPLAEKIADNDSPPCGRLRQLIDDQTVGLAGGGPPAEVNLHHLTAGTAAAAIRRSRETMIRSLGDRCFVYARSAGETPGDAGELIAESGFCGALPIDLAAGSGWREESKLIWQSGPPELDALVCRPIDASQSHGFLSLAPDLGQSIDSGEIATALLVHWPDSESEAYRDLRRAASWGLALGRFWKIDEYFKSGERPFHHYRGRADEGAGNWLARQVESGAADPLSSAARTYRAAVFAEAAQAIRAMAVMVAGDRGADADSGNGAAASDENAAVDEALRRLAKALGAEPAAASGEASKRVLAVNPHMTALRTDLRLPGAPRPTEAALKAQLFGVSPADSGCDVTVDVPGGGFVFLDGSGRPPRRSWFKRRRQLAAGTRLSNEFMEVEISPGGGVQGVYSGKGRGNRFSLRLVHVGREETTPDGSDRMSADSLSVLRSDEAVGEIEARGKLLDSSDRPVAAYTINYRLTRGSRWLGIRARLRCEPSVVLDDDPWNSYFAFRSAVASDALSLLVPLRDRLYRAGSGKRLDSTGGLVIDEVEHQTILFADGRPAYRRVGDRFIDSLLLVKGETAENFSMAIGFDVKEPLAALRGAICPPPVLQLQRTAVNETGWLVTCSTPEVTVSDMQVASVRPITLTMLVITTRGESRKPRLRFCRRVVAAEKVSSPYEPAAPAAAAEATDRNGSATPATDSGISFSDDEVTLSMTGHEVIRLKVVLA